ncbi:RagB/SusD family nutrient uptake outer membrane protein [Pedobacter nyackensis]|uniref:SusD family protein n=1 Tax=Pedobacter nyackensis TaxID=475255 RepID=A0A1W2C2G8_9SPHI|nr:RagB/SusD family nutrient uptake outer membrane protein [Pedobacter nyackensis]SMC79437.1 SusD family protein [Pedobacter nyackensis]
MKRFNKYIVSLIGASVLFSSCEKYLDQSPDMRAEINSIDKVGQLLVSAYPKYNYLAIAETYSDNVVDKGFGVGHINEPFVSLYAWEDIEDNGNNTPIQYWNACYTAINNANQALEAIVKNKFGDEAKQYRGEALVARAYAHFMLVTFFAKEYTIGEANTAPGIPYILAPETTTLPQYNRGTVASVYAQIEKDLEEGLPLLEGGKWKVPKYHFTPAAAHAFASRFYLFKGDWDKVIQHSTLMVPGGSYVNNLRPWNTALTNYTAAEFPVEITKADKSYNILLSETFSTFQRSSISGTTRYGFGTTIFQNIYNGLTVTGARFYNKGLLWSDNNYTTFVFKEYFHYTNVTAGTGLACLMQPLFISDEGLMNRAEAYIQKGEFTAALADLNTFAAVRITGYNPTTHAVTLAKAKTFFKVTDDKDALIKTVLQFKQIGWMNEGMRWLDILRHHLPVVHNHLAIDGTETFRTLEPNDNRRMFQIPKEAQIAGVALNPR